LHQELEEERLKKFPKLHWLIRIYDTEVLYLKNKLIMTLVIDSCHRDHLHKGQKKKMAMSDDVRITLCIFLRISTTTTITDTES
jgi:hypothetical protein